MRLAVIQALKDFGENGGNVKDKYIYNGMIKFISFLGGAYLIDTFSRDEIYQKAYGELIKLEDELKKNKIKKFTLN